MCKLQFNEVSACGYVMLDSNDAHLAGLSSNAVHERRQEVGGRMGTRDPRSKLSLIAACHNVGVQSNISVGQL